MLFDTTTLSHVFSSPVDTGDGVASSGAPPPPIIQADRTQEGDVHASRLWRVCRRKNKQPEEITAEELQGRGAEQLLTELCQFATDMLSTVSTSLRNTNLSERINKNEGDAGHNFADALV